MTITVVQTLTPNSNTQTVTGLASGDVVLWLMKYHGAARALYTFAQNSQTSHLRLRAVGALPEDDDVSYTVPAHPTQPAGTWADWSVPFWYQERNSYPSNYWEGTPFYAYGNVDGSQYEDVYLFVYPITGITTGDYELTFEMPTPEDATSTPIGAATLRVMWGKVLRGVDLTKIGKASEYPEYTSGRPGRQGETYESTYNDFPVTASLPVGVNSAYLVAYLEGGAMDTPDDYGTKIGEFYDSGSYLQTLIYDRGVITAASTFANPPVGSVYEVYLSWFMLYGVETVAPTGPTVYFADMIVFNAATGGTVEF